MSFTKDAKIYFKMLFNYKPKSFWNELLSNSFDLRAVGHFRKSNEENQKMYEEKKGIIENILLKNAIIINENIKVLEIGCGVGYWTEYLKNKGVKNYIGNDIAQISVDVLSKSFPDYNFIKGDIGEIEIKENDFDLVLIIDVTQHITDDEKFDIAISKIWDKIKTNGYFLFTYWDQKKNKFLINKLRLNKIEKPRGIQEYTKNINSGFNILHNEDFNDKNIVLIKKLS